MRHRYVDGTIAIPFCSKVSLMAASHRLRRTGLNIRKEIIEKLTPKPPAKRATSKKPAIKAKKPISSPHKRPAKP